MTILSASVDWLDRFEPIGVNCETGFVLQHFGSKRSGLLWWTYIEPADLIQVLEQRFANFFAFESLRPHTSTMVIDKNYKCVFHSAMHSDEDKIFTLPDLRLNALYRIERQRIDKDVADFTDRLRTGRRTCILKSQAIDDVILPRVLDAIDVFSGHTLNGLLVVTEPRDGNDRPGHLDPVSPRIMRGFVSAVAPIAAANEAKHVEWHSLLLGAAEAANGFS